MGAAALNDLLQEGAKVVSGASASGRAKGRFQPAGRTVQMNTRIEAEVKKRGDLAFARVGRTPSQMTRALWAFAGRNENNPEVLRHLVEELEGRTDEEGAVDARAQRMDSMQQARRLLDGFCRDHGLEPGVSGQGEGLGSYLERLREQDALEQMRAEGYRL